MNVRDLIRLLLEQDLDAEVFFDVEIPNPEEFDLLAVNSVIEVGNEDGESPMIILSAETYNDPTLN